MARGRRTAAITAAALTAAAALAGCGGDEGGEPRPVSDGPNIVFITSDDQALDSFNREAMPKTFNLLVDQGTVPQDFVVTTPLCCPSRASLLTGQYGHNNGVLSNHYENLKNPESTLPVWLRDSGYTTAHVGKYLNNYDKAAPDVGPAPGWDGWATVIGASYYDYDLYTADGPRHYGEAPADYLGVVTTQRAVGVITDQADDERPLFMQVDYYQPHPDPSADKRCGDTALPDPRDSGAFKDPQLPMPPSFNEREVSDKPPFLRRAPLDEHAIERMRRRFGCSLASMRSVDRGVEAIVAALREQGELDDTVIAFMSDNGVLRGHHRFSGGKHIAYEETYRVPVALRVPAERLGGAEPPARLKGPAANIDLAPTFLDLAGAGPCSVDDNCRVMDGRSLVPALSGKKPLDPKRVRLIEIDEGANPDKFVGPCRYRGMLEGDVFYIEHEIAQSRRTGECVQVNDREMYDLERDPYQLRNIVRRHRVFFVDPSAEYAKTLERLHDCQGIRGRDPKPPKGIAYCE